MAQDHFIAQTYLKHFGDPECKGMLHAYRKRDEATFLCWPKDVCREPDGDLNPMFVERPDLLGDFRNIFEPHWNPAVDGILSSSVSPSEKFLISAYMANLMACTPAWRRIGVKMYNHIAVQTLSFAKQIHEKHGGVPEFSDEMVKAVEMLERGELRFETKPDYAKAVATKQLLEYAWTTYNQHWLIISNRTARPFITSDNPVAIDQPDVPGAVMLRYLPITPHVCLAVKYDNRTVEQLDLEKAGEYARRSPQGTIGHVEFSLGGVKMVNRLVAQCAEELVFSSEWSSGTAALVKKYANYGVDAELRKIPLREKDGFYIVSTLAVRDRTCSERA